MWGDLLVLSPNQTDKFYKTRTSGSTVYNLGPYNYYLFDFQNEAFNFRNQTFDFRNQGTRRSKPYPENS